MVVVVVSIGTVAGIAIARPFGTKTKTNTIDNGSPTTTATITQGRLTARTPVNGTLGYSGSYKLINRLNGTYSQLPRVGQAFSRGQVLYRVNNDPVILLTGADVPFYRDLSQGAKGPDVQELNANLVALGYASDGNLDAHSSTFGADTKVALKSLQGDLHVKVTGTLSLGTAVFVPISKIRITEINVTNGVIAAPGSPVLNVSSTNRNVQISLDASSQASVKVGDEVTITLPNLKTTPGKVTSVGTVATKSSTGTSTINVDIAPTDPKATGSLDQAPVSVSIVTDSASDVLAVPVTALMAMASGGYAVEVVQANGTHKLVPVTLGLFDTTAGTVAVSGTGLAVGQRVVVPAS